MGWTMGKLLKETEEKLTKETQEYRCMVKIRRMFLRFIKSIYIEVKYRFGRESR